MTNPNEHLTEFRVHNDAVRVIVRTKMNEVQRVNFATALGVQLSDLDNHIEYYDFLTHAGMEFLRDHGFLAGDPHTVSADRRAP